MSVQLCDPFPDEYPMDDEGVLAIVGARFEARDRGEYPPTELQAYRLVLKQHAEIERMWEALATVERNDRTPTYEYGEPLRNGTKPGVGQRFKTPREIVRDLNLAPAARKEAT